MLLDAERDRWMLWAPIFFGAAIAANFSLSIEPEGWVDPICTVTALSVAIYYRHIQAVIFAMLAFTLFLAGFSNVNFEVIGLKRRFYQNLWIQEFSAAAFYELKRS